MIYTTKIYICTPAGLTKEEDETVRLNIRRELTRPLRIFAEWEQSVCVVDVTPYTLRSNARINLLPHVNDILDTIVECTAVIKAPGCDEDPLCRFELQFSQYADCRILVPESQQKRRIQV